MSSRSPTVTSCAPRDPIPCTGRRAVPAMHSLCHGGRPSRSTPKHTPWRRSHCALERSRPRAPPCPQRARSSNECRKRWRRLQSSRLETPCAASTRVCLTQIQCNRAHRRDIAVGVFRLNGRSRKHHHHALDGRHVLMDYFLRANSLQSLVVSGTAAFIFV